MRINEFSFTPPSVTFYGIGIDDFILFSGTDLKSLKQMATECQNGVRDSLPPEKIKLFKFTIEELV